MGNSAMKAECKLYGGGFDILKFVMAFLIIAIHTDGLNGEFCSIYLKPFTEIAVPVFFVLSSFLYFRKLTLGAWNMDALLHFAKRIGILYLFWFCVKMPILLLEQGYFIRGGLADVGRLTFDVLFRYTFYGSWFFSSLVWAVAIITLSFRFRLLRDLVLALSALTFVYVYTIDDLPLNLHVFYDWWSSHIRRNVHLTLLESLPWVALGALLSNINFQSLLWNRRGVRCSLTSVCVLSLPAYLYCENGGGNSLLIKLFLAVVLIIVAGAAQIPNSNNLKHLRNLSILFYMIHFDVVYVIQTLCGHYYRSDITALIGYIPTFFLVTVITYFIAETLLRLSQHPKCSILKFAY